METYLGRGFLFWCVQQITAVDLTPFTGDFLIDQGLVQPQFSTPGNQNQVALRINREVFCANKSQTDGLGSAPGATTKSCSNCR